MMQPFTFVTGQAAPLMQANIDTDVIIRIERLIDPSPANLSAYALEALRFLPDGSENPDCLLNQPRFKGAPILLAGANFGCGSSREGAVWALMALGIRCIIAASFGDIFSSNCFQNGVLPVVLPESTVQALAEQARAHDHPMTIDLVRQLVISPEGEERAFVIDPLRREALLAGLDAIGQTLTYASDIAAWQAADRVARPWVWQPVTTHHAQR
jgi:3-isopropylmalate/(R)-2-methylmalate dehydratase small subunit